MRRQDQRRHSALAGIGARSYVHAMKRLSVIAAIILPLLLVSAASAQDNPAAAAAREEADERVRALTAKVENLEESILRYDERFKALTREIRNLQDEISRLGQRKESVAQDDLKRLAEKIEEVDRKRIEDNQKLLAAVTKMVKGVADQAAPPPSGGARKPPVVDTGTKPPAGQEPAPPGTGTEKGFKYAIKDGDTLANIVPRLRAHGLKVTQKQVMDANPKVNWTRLRIGQEIFIPDPGGAN
jgi:TolA-binding protein